MLVMILYLIFTLFEKEIQPSQQFLTENPSIHINRTVPVYPSPCEDTRMTSLYLPGENKPLFDLRPCGDASKEQIGCCFLQKTSKVHWSQLVIEDEAMLVHGPTDVLNVTIGERRRRDVKQNA